PVVNVGAVGLREEFFENQVAENLLLVRLSGGHVRYLRHRRSVFCGSGVLNIIAAGIFGRAAVLRLSNDLGHRGARERLTGFDALGDLLTGFGGGVWRSQLVEGAYWQIRTPQFVESRILLRLIKMNEAIGSLIGPAEFGFNPGQPSPATGMLLRLVEIAPDREDVFLDALAQAENF